MPRGRNKALIARRDEMLCHRYHYWTETQRLRFDDTPYSFLVLNYS